MESGFKINLCEECFSFKGKFRYDLHEKITFGELRKKYKIFEKGWTCHGIEIGCKGNGKIYSEDGFCYYSKEHKAAICMKCLRH